MTLTDTELDRRSTRRCLDKPIDRAVIRTEELRPFARLLVERVADPRIRHDEPALQDFYSRALSAIEAQASRSSGRPEVPVEAAFLEETGNVLRLPAVFPNREYARVQIEELMQLVNRHFDDLEQAASAAN